MEAILDGIKVGRISYLVEPATPADTHVIPIRFILHHPRGPKYLLIPETGRPDRLVAIRPITAFARYRPTPLGGTRFAVDDGKLVLATSDE